MNATVAPAASTKAANLKRRCTGGAIAIGLLAAIVTIDRRLEHPWVALSVVSALGVVGAAEFAGMMRAAGHGIRGAGLVAAAVVLLLGKVYCYVAAPSVSPLEFAALVLGGVLIVDLCVAVVRGESEPGVERVAYRLMGIGYIGLYSFLLDLLLAPPAPRGVEIALWLVFVSKSNDIGGYLIGNLIGGPKLAPKVSPGKTRSGSLGGVFLSVVVAYSGANWIGIDLVPWQIGALALAISIVTQFGDLAESLLKRACGVKDSGSLLPTFGGALDVIDSLAFAAPVGYVCLRAFSALS